MFCEDLDGWDGGGAEGGPRGKGYMYQCVHEFKFQLAHCYEQCAEIALSCPDMRLPFFHCVHPGSAGDDYHQSHCCIQ